MNLKSYLLFADEVDRTKKFITFCFKMNYYSFSILGQLMLLHLLHGEYNIQNSNTNLWFSTDVYMTRSHIHTCSNNLFTIPTVLKRAR